MKIRFFSREGCSPCVFLSELAVKKFKNEDFEIIKYDNDEDLIPVLEDYGVTGVPFIVVNDKDIYNGMDLVRFINKFKST